LEIAVDLDSPLSSAILPQLGSEVRVQRRVL